jgi:hypothetical protein
MLRGLLAAMSEADVTRLEFAGGLFSIRARSISPKQLRAREQWS